MIFRKGITIWTDHSFVLSQITRLTDRRTGGQIDRQTDRILIAKPVIKIKSQGTAN